MVDLLQELAAMRHVNVVAHRSSESFELLVYLRHQRPSPKAKRLFPDCSGCDVESSRRASSCTEVFHQDQQPMMTRRTPAAMRPTATQSMSLRGFGGCPFTSPVFHWRSSYARDAAVIEMPAISAVVLHQVTIGDHLET